jgi:type IV pilus assembly protein PilM
MAKQITTLYINDKSIRLMVTNGKKISKLAEVPLDIDLEDVSNEEKEEELVNKIKHLFSANKIGPTRFIFGMTGLHSLSRPVVLPLLPKTMQGEAMTREAKRLLPVPPEQLHISWQILSSDETRMRAFIVAMPRQTADYLLNALEKAGLKPYLMDIKPLALSRLIKEKTAILIDVQETECDIVILSDGFPQPMRTVSFPHDSLSYDEKLSIVKDELKRTVQFFNSNNPENMLSPETVVYISGEFADDNESFEALSTELGYPVAPLTSPQKCPKQLDPSHYLVNVGLALKELPRESGSIIANLNTLPGGLLPKPISRDRLLAIPAVVAGIAVIAAFVVIIQNIASDVGSANDQVQANNFIIEKKQNEKTELLADIEALEQQISQYQALNDSLSVTGGYIDNYSDEVTYNMKATVDNTEDGITIERIEYVQGDTVRVYGIALHEEEVIAYARNIEYTNRFDEVTVTQIADVEDEEENVYKEFVLTFLLKG